VEARHDPAIVAGILAALETALDRAMALAPDAKQDLQELAGTVLAIEFTQPAAECYVAIGSDGALSLTQHCELPVATRVRGQLQDFIRLASSDDPAATLINSDLEVVGNTAPLLAVQAIVANLDPDWEAPLVDALGDVAGHQVAQGLRGFFNWGRGAAESLRRQLSEFILEEGRLSPPKAELNHFFKEIDALGLKVDRLQSRIKKFARDLEAGKS